MSPEMVRASRMGAGLVAGAGVVAVQGAPGATERLADRAGQAHPANQLKIPRNSFVVLRKIIDYQRLCGDLTAGPFGFNLSEWITGHDLPAAASHQAYSAGVTIRG
jgi:hypothetical protein